LLLWHTHEQPLLGQPLSRDIHAELHRKFHIELHPDERFALWVHTRGLVPRRFGGAGRILPQMVPKLRDGQSILVRGKIDIQTVVL
jgi:hypothetical protein